MFTFDDLLSSDEQPRASRNTPAQVAIEEVVAKEKSGGRRSSATKEGNDKSNRMGFLRNQKLAGRTAVSGEHRARRQDGGGCGTVSHGRRHEVEAGLKGFE